MVVKLSSKGQLVIPKTIREQLNLGPATRFHIRLTEAGSIILDPIQADAVEALWGKYAGADLLADLEAEHQAELRRD
jgi:AbrB family looped-hinge helix DNA binding protein